MRNFYKFTYLILFSMCAKAQVPTATITSASVIYCTGYNATFKATGTATDVAFFWNITPSRSVSYNSLNDQQELNFSIGNAGTYTANLFLSSPTGTNLISKIINVVKSAKASFNASLSGQGFPTQLMLTNYSSNSTKSYWIFDGNVTHKDSSATLVKSYGSSGSHTVMLLALGTNGCNDESTYAFHIADSSGVTLPNVFTPNGDGVNDVYRPNAKGVVSLNAWVYNRQGLTIAHWDKINGFWDGYTTSGELCTAGEYFVVVEAIGFDGKSYKLKSAITLSR